MGVLSLRKKERKDIGEQPSLTATPRDAGILAEYSSGIAFRFSSFGRGLCSVFGKDIWECLKLFFNIH